MSHFRPDRPTSPVSRPPAPPPSSSPPTPPVPAAPPAAGPAPREVFEVLVREHGPALTDYLRAVTRDPAVADDLFQETFLTAWAAVRRV